MFFGECAVVDFPGVSTGTGDHVFFVIFFINNVAIFVDLGSIADNFRIEAVGIVVVTTLRGFGGFVFKEVFGLVTSKGFEVFISDLIICNVITHITKGILGFSMVS